MAEQFNAEASALFTLAENFSVEATEPITMAENLCTMAEQISVEASASPTMAENFRVSATHFRIRTNELGIKATSNHHTHHCQPPTANCRLIPIATETADCQLPTEDCRLKTEDCQLPTAY